MIITAMTMITMKIITTITVVIIIKIKKKNNSNNNSKNKFRNNQKKPLNRPHHPRLPNAVSWSAEHLGAEHTPVALVSLLLSGQPLFGRLGHGHSG